MSTKVNTPQFRVAFPSVFQPKKNDMSGKDEYSVVALFEKGVDLKKLKIAARAALEKKFGPDQKKWPKGLKSPFKKQEDREKENDKGVLVMPQGFERGCIYLDLKSQQKPGLVDGQIEKIIDSSEFYGGCYAIASVQAFGYDVNGNKGVSFGLQNIQKVKDGDPFGNRSKAEDDFSAVENNDADGEAGDTDDLWT